MTKSEIAELQEGQASLRNRTQYLHYKTRALVHHLADGMKELGTEIYAGDKALVDQFKPQYEMLKRNITALQDSVATVEMLNHTFEYLNRSFDSSSTKISHLQHRITDEHEQRAKTDSHLLSQLTQEKEFQAHYMQKVQSKFHRANETYQKLLGQVHDSIDGQVDKLRHDLEDEQNDRISNVTHLLQIVTRMKNHVDDGLAKQASETKALDQKTSGWRDALRESLKESVTGLGKKIADNKRNATKSLEKLRDDLSDVQHVLEKQLRHRVVDKDFDHLKTRVYDLGQNERHLKGREDHQRARLNRLDDGLSDLQADVTTVAHDNDQLTKQEKDDVSKLSGDLSYFQGHIEQEVDSLKNPHIF